MNRWTETETTRRIQGRFNKMGSALLAAQRDARTQESLIQDLLEQIDRLIWQDDICQGCGVDRTGDWMGRHRPNCNVAEVTKPREVRAKG